MTPKYMRSSSSKHSIFLQRRSPKIRIIQSIFLVFHLSSELYDMKKFYYFIKIKNVVSDLFPRVCYVAFYLFISVIGKWTFDKKLCLCKYCLHICIMNSEQFFSQKKSPKSLNVWDIFLTSQGMSKANPCDFFLQDF